MQVMKSTVTQLNWNYLWNSQGMKRIQGGTFFARIEHCSQKLWPEVNSKVHISKVRVHTWFKVTKVRKRVVAPNKGTEGALPARGVLLVSIPTLCYPVILCFTFLFTSSLSTLHCLGQVLFFLKITHFYKSRNGNETTILFKRCCICKLSMRRIAGSHTTMWTKLNFFEHWKFAS